MLELLRGSEKGGGRRELCDNVLHNCYFSSDIIWVENEGK
jgi:hypothetical protein